MNMTVLGDTAAARIADLVLADSAGKARRSDAQRNALRLIAAAQQALDDVGLEASSHEIARRAGVGVGTFYRQVSSLPDLMTAILTELLDQIVTAADDAEANPDPWEGFVSFATAFVRLGTASCGVRDALRAEQQLDIAPTIKIMRTRIRQLVQKTQQTGALRDDLSWKDVACVLASVFPPEQTLGDKNPPDQWRRNLDVVLTGLHSQPSQTRRTAQRRERAI
jgi:AcrR family transcriptional regulator